MPILYVMPYDSLDEAIALNNDVPQGLSSCIFTNDQGEAERLVSAEGSDCGISNVNIGNSGAEFGGASVGRNRTAAVVSQARTPGGAACVGLRTPSTLPASFHWAKVSISRSSSRDRSWNGGRSIQTGQGSRRQGASQNIHWWREAIMNASCICLTVPGSACAARRSRICWARCVVAANSGSRWVLIQSASGCPMSSPMPFLEAATHILVDPEAGQDARGLNLVAACGRQREQLRRVGRAYGRSAAGPQVGNMCGVQLALYENGRCGAVGPEHLLVGRSALARCRCQDPAVVGEIVRILWHVAGEPFAGSLLSFSAVRKGSSSIVL